MQLPLTQPSKKTLLPQCNKLNFSKISNYTRARTIVDDSIWRIQYSRRHGNIQNAANSTHSYRNWRPAYKLRLAYDNIAKCHKFWRPTNMARAYARMGYSKYTSCTHYRQSKQNYIHSNSSETPITSACAFSSYAKEGLLPFKVSLTCHTYSSFSKQQYMYCPSDLKGHSQAFSPCPPNATPPSPRHQSEYLTDAQLHVPNFPYNTSERHRWETRTIKAVPLLLDVFREQGALVGNDDQAVDLHRMHNL